MNILLLEDDIILNELISEYLMELSYYVDICFDGYDAQNKAYSKKYDLLVLDVNVPNINGFDILKDLRANQNNTPAIFITSMYEMKDMQKGFESGGDDYIKKPFELEELGLRIDNIKRIYNINNKDIVNISTNIRFNLRMNELIKENKTIHISKKESKILEYFINNTGKVISMEEIGSNVWGYDNIPNNATIRTYIKTLRMHLEEQFITNIKGVGYCFNKL